MRKSIFGRFCLYTLASAFLLLSTLKYAMADYPLANGCGMPVCTGTGYKNTGYCSRLECENQICSGDEGNWVVYANSSQVYVNTATGFTCHGNFQSGYQKTDACCAPNGG